MSEPVETGDRTAAPTTVYVVLAVLTLLTTARPTAVFVAALLRWAGLEATATGGLLTVTGLPARPIGELATAAPAVLIGGWLMAARRGPAGKTIGGLCLLTFNTFFIAVLEISFLAQMIEEHYALFSRWLLVAHPLLMLLTVAAIYAYWVRRVLPDRPVGVGPSKVGHARELLPPTAAPEPEPEGDDG